MVIRLDTGNVGIGFDSPQARLTVRWPGESQTSYTAEFLNSPSTHGAGGILFSQGSTYAYKWFTGATGGTSGSLRLDYINRSDGSVVYAAILNIAEGQVGIGVYPTEKLHVAGNIRSRNIIPDADASYNLGSSTQRWNNVHAVKIYGSVGSPQPLDKPLGGLHDIKNVRFREDGLPHEDSLPTFEPDKGEDVVNLCHTIGWLVQCVKELSDKVERLERMIGGGS